jgi:23S rRNA (uracil1939-C5)-methyltransferase
LNNSARTIAVRVDRLAPGGDGVGRQRGGEHDGRATFVPLAAPGDEVRVVLLREKARVAWGELAEVVAASPARVAPRCPLYGRCGGCQWQHVDLDAQHSAKRAIVARALGLADVPLLAPSPAGWGYRERARLVVGRGGAVGFRARRSHEVVDVPACPLLSPALERALGAVRLVAPELAFGTEIDLLAGGPGGKQVHVAISAPIEPRLAERLRAGGREHGVVGIAAANGAWGQPDVDVAEPGAAPLRVPANGFAQVGRAANAALVRAVDEALAASGAFPAHGAAQVAAGAVASPSAPRTVLELYAGSGNFTRRLAERAAASGAALLACDGDPAAVARGQRQVSGASWLSAPPDDLVADVVIVDPPREGLDARSLALARRARRALVYVSCDPQTLGRDTARLRAEGFTLAYAMALDLMPHTFHVEVVVGLVRT